MPTIPLNTLNLDAIPTAEDESFEYKSSKTPLAKLKEKINRAASAFCNSGGGCFIAGVMGDGKPDGGIEQTVGRQSLRDWVDQAIASVSPVANYNVRLFDQIGPIGCLDTGKVILAISFPESHSAPHMADDKKYYIRAGAHSVPASSFIVESIWAHRSVSKPLLSHAIREKPGNVSVVQIGVVALNSSPAIDVEFQIDPLVGMLRHLEKYFPIRLPIVDQNTPFFVDCMMYHQIDSELPDEVAVRLKYRDINGREYSYKSTRPLKEAINPIRIGSDPLEKIARAIEKLAKSS